MRMQNGLGHFLLHCNEAPVEMVINFSSNEQVATGYSSVYAKLRGCLDLLSAILRALWARWSAIAEEREIPVEQFPTTSAAGSVSESAHRIDTVSFTGGSYTLYIRLGVSQRDAIRAGLVRDIYLLQAAVDSADGVVRWKQTIGPGDLSSVFGPSAPS